MRNLETNDWIILNTVIYKIYTTPKLDAMREQFLEQMKMVFDFDSADFFLASLDGTEQMMMPVTFNCDEEPPELLAQLYYERGSQYSGKSLVYRETDVITEDRRVETEYYKQVYEPNHWHYSLQMILSYNKHFLGVVTFYRNFGKENFLYDDIFVLNLLKDHLAFRLYKEAERDHSTDEKLTVTQTCEKYGLTQREHTILQLLMNGRDNAAICNELAITVNTLKKHILNIYRKLGIKNRVQLFKMVKEKEE